MTFHELSLTFLLLAVVLTATLHQYSISATALREAKALHSVHHALRTGLAGDDCDAIYGKSYEDLQALRTAINWQEPLDTVTVSRDWRVDVGTGESADLVRVRVRYPGIAMARSISEKLTFYSNSQVDPDGQGATLSWWTDLTRAAPLHSDGLLVGDHALRGTDHVQTSGHFRC